MKHLRIIVGGGAERLLASSPTPHVGSAKRALELCHGKIILSEGMSGVGLLKRGAAETASGSRVDDC